MSIEEHNLERTRQETSIVELSKDTAILEETERNSSLANLEKSENRNDSSQQDAKNPNLASMIHPAAVAYGIHKLAEMPMVKETVDNCKASIGETFSDWGHMIDEFFVGVYDGVKDFFAGNDADAKAIDNLGNNFVEERDFGLDKCTEAAKEIFNPGIIENWANLSLEQRQQIAGAYAAEVADAFELHNYTGVYFEDLDLGVMGYNNGDGSIHLSNTLIAPWTSPLEIMNTITHELRHQYQFEAVQGYHNVADDVRKEWATAQEIYNYDQPYCYDPWGYTYNPLEIDARYAGETVVRNVTHDMINA
ncbi:MAG: hypothetical protein J6B92_05380 [Paraprevotella sp.]|nr:hypothetical protein [Paraprevotella sp.]